MRAAVLYNILLDESLACAKRLCIWKTEKKKKREKLKDAIYILNRDVYLHVPRVDLPPVDRADVVARASTLP